MRFHFVLLTLLPLLLTACSSENHFLSNDPTATAEHMIQDIKSFEGSQVRKIPADHEMNTRDQDVIFIDNGTFIMADEQGRISEMHFYDMTNQQVEDIFSFLNLDIPHGMRSMMWDDKVEANGYQGELDGVSIFYDDGASWGSYDDSNQEALKYVRMIFDYTAEAESEEP